MINFNINVILQGNGTIICRAGDEFKQLVEEIWPWVDFLVYSFLPFLTIMVLNILIIREVSDKRIAIFFYFSL